MFLNNSKIKFYYVFLIIFFLLVFLSSNVFAAYGSYNDRIGIRQPLLTPEDIYLNLKWVSIDDYLNYFFVFRYDIEFYNSFVLMVHNVTKDFKTIFLYGLDDLPSSDIWEGNVVDYTSTGPISQVITIDDIYNNDYFSYEAIQDLYWDHGDGPVNYDNYGNPLVYGKDWGCRFRDLDICQITNPNDNDFYEFSIQGCLYSPGNDMFYAGKDYSVILNLVEFGGNNGDDDDDDSFLGGLIDNIVGFFNRVLEILKLPFVLISDVFTSLKNIFVDIGDSLVDVKNIFKDVIDFLPNDILVLISLTLSLGLLFRILGR